MRPALLLTLATLALAPIPARSAAQVPPADTGRGMTATLLKRLGEIVDGHRTGRPIYVAISYRFPHAVAAVTGTLDSAQVAARLAGSQYGAIGPFETIAEAPRGAYYATQPCVKNPATSVVYCGDTSMAYFAGPVPVADVQGVTVSVTTRDGRVHTETFTPEGVEAVFFTMASIDKFVIPYYERVLGVQYAAELRARLQAAYVPTH